MKTYFQLSSLVVAGLVALQVVSGLLSPEECANLIACTTEFAPVCGSDHHTYNNQCEMNMATCKTRDETLHVAAQGPCPTKDLRFECETDASMTGSFSHDASRRRPPIPARCLSSQATSQSEVPSPQFASRGRPASNRNQTPKRTRSVMKTPRSFEFLLLSSLLVLTHAQDPATTPPKCVFDCPVMTETSAKQLVCGSDGNPHPSLCMLKYASCLHPERVKPEAAAPEHCAFFSTLGAGDPNFAGIIMMPTNPASHSPNNGTETETTDSSSSGDGDSSEPDSNQVIIVIIEEDTPPPATGNSTPTAAPTKSPSMDETHDFGDDPLFQNTAWTITQADESSNGSSDSGSDDGGSTRCEIMCMTRYEPVCASNGVTYSNSCELAAARCLNPKLVRNHIGACKGDMVIVIAQPEPPNKTPPYPLALKPSEKGYDPCAYVCPMFDAPVCSRDGHIYENRCVYASAYCRDSTLADATTEICKGARA